MSSAERSRAGRGAVWACCVATSLLGPSLTSPAQASAPAQTERSIQVDPDGPVRFYIVAEPSTYCPGAPVVVLLHGGSQSMRKILESRQAPSRWLDLAEQHAILLLLPNGYNVEQMSGAGDEQTWNDLRPSVPGTNVSEEDDVAFIEAMLDAEADRLGFDARAVFITGSSNGGMMAFRMLIERPDRFAAGAAFIANLPQADIPDPSAPTPVMIMNGDADPQMPWEGGVVGVSGAPVRSAIDTLAYWRRVNGVSDAPAATTALPDIAPDDATRVLRTDIAQPGADAPSVVFYRVVNGGHAIPVLADDPQTPLPESIGLRSHDVRGVDEAWAFFQAHLPATSGTPDLDADGAVGPADLATLLASWGAQGHADLDADRDIGSADLGILLAAWGPCP